MAESIRGGATKDAAGNWQDANGKPLDKSAVAEAEKLAEETLAQKREADRLQRETEALQNPVAAAMYIQQMIAAQQAAAPKASK